MQGYKSGNEDEHKGFGHIAISVDDVQGSCDRLESLGVRFKVSLFLCNQE